MSKTENRARAYRGPNNPSYTNAANNEPSRCNGCGSLYGMGHYDSCFDRASQRLKLPSPTVPRKGSAKWYQSHGKMLKDLYSNGGSWNGK